MQDQQRIPTPLEETPEEEEEEGQIAHQDRIGHLVCRRCVSAGVYGWFLDSVFVSLVSISFSTSIYILL